MSLDCCWLPALIYVLVYHLCRDIHSEDLGGTLFCAWTAIFGVYLYNAQKLSAAAVTSTNNSTQESQGLLNISNTTQHKHKASYMLFPFIICIVGFLRFANRSSAVSIMLYLFDKKVLLWQSTWWFFASSLVLNSEYLFITLPRCSIFAAKWNSRDGARINSCQRLQGKHYSTIATCANVLYKWLCLLSSQGIVMLRFQV